MFMHSLTTLLKCVPYSYGKRNIFSNCYENIVEKNSEQSELIQFIQTFLPMSGTESQSQEYSSAEDETEPLILVCQRSCLL